MADLNERAVLLGYFLVGLLVLLAVRIVWLAR